LTNLAVKEKKKFLARHGKKKVIADTLKDDPRQIKFSWKTGKLFQQE